MKRQTGVIITIVLAVLTLCCSATCCAAGAFVALDQGTAFGTYLRPGWGAVPVCLGVLVWIAPLLAWLLLVRNKEASQL